MRIVDSHAHVSPYWYEPIEGLVHQMDRVGVDRAVLVQFLGQEDNQYIIDCTLKFPGRFAVVAWVDPSRPDAADKVQNWVAAGARGIRLRCTDRSPGHDTLAIWKSVALAGVPVSCLGHFEDFIGNEFRHIVARFPETPIIMEHFGLLKHISAPFNEIRLLTSLANLPNLYVKIGGLGELAPHSMPFNPKSPFTEELTPVLSMLYETFGPKRMLWGSDFPLVSGREGYRSALEITKAQVPGSAADKDWIFGLTACCLYKFEVSGEPIACFVQ